MLNENNIAASFRLNADTGNYMPIKIENIIKLEQSSSRIQIHSSSSKIAIDLGYTIDGNVRESIFKTNNQRLIIKALPTIDALPKYSILDNECVIITDDISFKNIVWLNKEQMGKTFYYSILTCNSTLSAYDINFIAKKINKLDSNYINNSIEEIKNSINLLTTKLDILDADLYQAEISISEIKESLSSLSTDESL